MEKRSLPVPRDFLCPITREIMTNPVLLIEDGRSYECEAIERWLRHHNTSPMTNQPLIDRRYVSNYNLKNAIDEYCSIQKNLSSFNQFLQFHICPGQRPIEWNDKPTLKIRISLLGSSNVGKTTLAHFLQNGSQLNTQTSATIGTDLFYFYLDQLYENKYVIIIQLMDIPGMERYESCSDQHFRNCHGAILIVDSTNLDTLEHLELYWYKQLMTKGREHVQSIFICNKIDLFDDCDQTYRQVFFDRIEQFTSANQISIYHTSALRGDNIQLMFKQLILHIFNTDCLIKQIKGNETKNIFLEKKSPTTNQSLALSNCC